MGLELQVSWQVHYFVGLEVQISWQAQYFVGQAPAPATQILRACAVEMHFEEFEGHEFTVSLAAN